MESTEHPNDCAYCGSVSHGTLRDEDLIPAFVAALGERFGHVFEEIEHDSLRVRQLGQLEGVLKEIEARAMRLHFFGTEEAADAREWLLDKLNDFAPEGHWFGAHPGDGADFGYWPLELLE